MRRFGLVSYLVVSLVVLGSLAVAAPSFRATLHAPSPGPKTGVTGSSGAAVVQDEGGAPDFSACEGSTGLDNAVCRHEALLDVRPDNPGLRNSLARLQENRDRHAAKPAGGQGRGNGTANDRDEGGNGS